MCTFGLTIRLYSDGVKLTKPTKWVIHIGLLATMLIKCSADDLFHCGIECLAVNYCMMLKSICTM